MGEKRRKMPEKLLSDYKIEKIDYPHRNKVSFTVKIKSYSVILTIRVQKNAFLVSESSEIL